MEQFFVYASRTKYLYATHDVRDVDWLPLEEKQITKTTLSKPWLGSNLNNGSTINTLPTPVLMSTTNLPLELLIVIVVQCPKSAFPALCRTCKTFRNVIEPLLYHDICLSGHDVQRTTQADEIFHRIVSLYETLKSNREKASMVQRVEISELR